MKTFILIFLVFVITSCHTSTYVATNSEKETVKTAEAFVTSWLSNFETQNWDQLIAGVGPDALTVSNIETTRLYESLAGYIEYRRNANFKTTIQIDSLNTFALGKTNAIVNARYKMFFGEKGSTSTGNVAVFVLQKYDDKWLIREYSPHTYFTFNIDKSIPDPWNYRRDVIWRFNDAILQMGGMMMYFLDDAVKRGISPAESGKRIGKKFAEGWNSETGFKGFVKEMNQVLLSITTDTEIKEISDNKAVFRFTSVFINQAQYWNISEKEFIDFFGNTFMEIAAKMGTDCTLEKEGNNLILTLTKKS